MNRHVKSLFLITIFFLSYASPGHAVWSLLPAATQGITLAFSFIARVAVGITTALNLSDTANNQAKNVVIKKVVSKVKDKAIQKTVQTVAGQTAVTVLGSGNPKPQPPTSALTSAGSPTAPATGTTAAPRATTSSLVPQSISTQQSSASAPLSSGATAPKGQLSLTGVTTNTHAAGQTESRFTVTVSTNTTTSHPATTPAGAQQIEAATRCNNIIEAANRGQHVDIEAYNRHLAGGSMDEFVASLHARQQAAAKLAPSAPSLPTPGPSKPPLQLTGKGNIFQKKAAQLLKGAGEQIKRNEQVRNQLIKTGKLQEAKAVLDKAQQNGGPLGNEALTAMQKALKGAKNPPSLATPPAPPSYSATGTPHTGTPSMNTVQSPAPLPAQGSAPQLQQHFDPPTFQPPSIFDIQNVVIGETLRNEGLQLQNTGNQTDKSKSPVQKNNEPQKPEKPNKNDNKFPERYAAFASASKTVEELTKKYGDEIKTIIESVADKCRSIGLPLPDISTFQHVLSRHLKGGFELIRPNGKARSIFNATEDWIQLGIETWEKGTFTEPNVKIYDFGRVIGKSLETGEDISIVKVVLRAGRWLTTYALEK